jgi:hypothetical protein
MIDPTIRNYAHEARRRDCSRLRPLPQVEARTEIAAEFALAEELRLVVLRSLTVPLAEIARIG